MNLKLGVWKPVHSPSTDVERVDRTLVYELGRRNVDPSRQLRDSPASHLWAGQL